MFGVVMGLLTFLGAIVWAWVFRNKKGPRWESRSRRQQW